MAMIKKQSFGAIAGWRAVHMVLVINEPLNVSHLFNTWYAMSDNIFRSFLPLGTKAFGRSIWQTWNKVLTSVDRNLLQVLSRGNLGLITTMRGATINHH